jgi:hypothetical protein
VPHLSIRHIDTRHEAPDCGEYRQAAGAVWTRLNASQPPNQNCVRQQRQREYQVRLDFPLRHLAHNHDRSVMQSVIATSASQFASSMMFF